MRTVVHLSDLHFGKEEPQLVAAIGQKIIELHPDLLVVSGDLTQRATLSQFERARDFLRSLPFPQLVVPGNHDIAPWHQLIERMTESFRDYRHFITAEETPFYKDGEIAVVGINSARIFKRKGGRINMEQVEQCCERWARAPRDAVRILVSHHPFDLPPNHSDRDLIGRAHLAMARLAECRVDIFLAGHLHVAHVGGTARRYGIHRHSAVSVQAGTAVSTRLREQFNSWNVLRIEKSVIAVDRFQWDAAQQEFAVAASSEFHASAAGWSEQSERKLI